MGNTRGRPAAGSVPSASYPPVGGRHATWDRTA